MRTKILYLIFWVLWNVLLAAEVAFVIESAHSLIDIHFSGCAATSFANAPQGV